MITLHPSSIRGEVWIPSSKSQTIRALLIAFFSHGTSIIRNPLISADTRSCISVLETLGASIEYRDNTLHVDSSSITISEDDEITLDCGNSGTTTYLLYGLLGTLPFRKIILTGDDQLRRRPVKPLVDAYNDLGMNASCTAEGTPPVEITGHLRGGRTSIECRTSQYLSSLLLSLPLADKDSVVDVPLLYEKPYVSMTLSWLDRQKIRYRISSDLQHLEVEGRQHYTAFDETITGDFSSASFFFTAAALTGCTLTLRGLDMNDSQGDKGVLDILSAMGCTVSHSENAITVKGPSRLKGGTFDINAMPDSLPTLSILGAVTDSPLHLTNVKNARIKETDRIACMSENLRQLGLKVDEEEDGMIIHPGPVKGGLTVSGYHDHRIIMAMAILSLIIEGGLTIDDEKAAQVTFPTFFTLLDSVKKEKDK